MCGVEGFADGPIGDNYFTAPELIGVDYQGNIFVIGNENDGAGYVRIIDPNTLIVTTNYQGSCGESYMSAPPDVQFGIQLKNVICY